jgi:predicted NBD/HSP70 family sugar kinase
VRQALRLLERARRCAGPGGEHPLRVVAVSVPGVVARDGRTVRFASNIDQPTPYDFATPLEARLGAPVILENNVNLAAIGERWQGVATELDTFAVVAVGAGIGAGIMHRGELLRGANGAAGEVAFLPPDKGRRRTDTTAHDEAGGLSLLEAARRRTGWRGGLPATVHEIFERAAAGERPAVAVVEQECLRVARIVAAVCAVVDPEQVILTGGVGANDRLIAGVQRLTGQLALFPPPLVRSALGARASLVGALRLAADAAARQLLDAVAG